MGISSLARPIPRHRKWRSMKASRKAGAFTGAFLLAGGVAIPDTRFLRDDRLRANWACCASLPGETKHQFTFPPFTHTPLSSPELTYLPLGLETVVHE